MENGSRSRAGYHVYALASVLLAILAAALPSGVPKIVCWVLLLPSVLAFPYMTRRFDMRMGSRQLVLVYAALFGLLWLLLGANALGAQLPYGALYVAWAMAFLATVCTQSFIEARKR